MAVTKVCVILLGDEKQFKEYKLFKGDLEEEAGGNLEIEDLKDIHNAEGDVCNNIKNFIEKRDAVILVCSQNMKNIIENKLVIDVKMYGGKHLKLHGDILNECFSRSEIKQKVVLISLDTDDDVTSTVPEMLKDCNHFNVNSDDVFDQVISSIISL